jgi:cyclophilin family peptidyl-prolyl cis-trans isomerase
MVAGAGPGALSLSPAACCAECAATRGCNVWVACMEPRQCGQQCWLKWAEDPAKPAVRGDAPSVPWHAGTLMKDAAYLARVPTEAQLNATRVVALKTRFGDLRIRLRDDWHLPSVRYVQQVALGDVCTVKCQLYRAEPGFLLQGGMRAVIAPNKLTHEKPRGTPMEKGDVAWAGGSSGPDFFITMHKVPGFGGSHTVWGELADADSMALAERLVQRKISPTVKPGEMRILDEPITFTVADATAAA